MRMNRPSPDDMKAMQVMEYVAELEKDNKELKEKLALTENDRDEWEVKARDMMKENKELRQEIEGLRGSNNVISENMKKFKYDNVRLREENSKLIKQCGVPK